MTSAFSGLRTFVGLLALVGASITLVAPPASAITQHCDDHKSEVKVEDWESPKTVMVDDTTTGKPIQVVVTITGSGFVVEPTDPKVTLTDADWCVKSSTRTNDGTGVSGKSESYNKRGIRQDISYVVIYSVTSKPSSPPQQCNTSTTSGGEGVTETVHELGTAGPTSFVFSYEAYSVPDHFQVFYEGVVIYDTGGPVSGGATPTVSVPAGTSTQVTVRVTGPSGTAWDYVVNCPTSQTS